MKLLKNNQVIIENIFYAKTLKERAEGLLGKDIAEPLYLQTRIHTFGMKFPIDVVICDKEMIVQKIFTNMGPSRIVVWNPKWNNVLELEAGMAIRLNLQPSERLQLVL
jgi:uncharacterized membrane protein (UPF0127 family)